MPYPSTPRISEPKVFDRAILKESQPYKLLLMRLYQGLDGSNKKTLAREVGMEEKEVRRHVKILKSMDFVTIEGAPFYHPGGWQHLIVLTKKGKQHARSLIQEEASWFSTVSHTPKEVWVMYQDR